MTAISQNYRELARDEAARVAAECAEAWLNADIPQRQYELAVKPELEALKNGRPCSAFAALIRVMSYIPTKFLLGNPKILDVGASSGYYGEVIRTMFPDVTFSYTACDFSRHFKAMAERLYPGINYEIADATALPFHDDFFEIVLSGACIMHVPEYWRAVREAVRVARNYVIFHRTPVTYRATSCWLKEGYGVPMFEIHFNEHELLELLRDNGLMLIRAEDVFWSNGEGHRTYLLAKEPGLNHVAV